jgi:circadian clock protein KaiC
MPSREAPKTWAATGIAALDDVLGGGFVPNRLYLIEGVPGAGKTTLALQFLLEGVRQGEPVLYVTLSETEDELRDAVLSHGWRLDGITVRELVPSEDALQPDDQYSMFHPSEIELSETTRSILTDVDRIQPKRVVFDSLSELRLLAGNSLRYRRQLLGLKQFFAGRHSTVLLLDDMTSENHDMQVQSIAHGVIRLEQVQAEYGGHRRRLSVLKYRGVDFRAGFHDYVIKRGGIEVYPRLAAKDRIVVPRGDRLSSGVEQLDGLLGGGIERGTSTLFVGAPGTGKSTIAAQFVATAAQRGESAAMFIFDESIYTLLSRTDGLGIGLREQVENGRVSVQQIDPAELSPGEFAQRIRAAVETRKVAIVVIDSLNGYLNAMPAERHLIVHLHELLSYLGHAGVATLLIGAHQGLIGERMSAPVDASYLADSIVLLRYFEAGGEVRQAVSVVKKRGGAHERTIREYRLQPGHLSVGPPLRNFHGVLTGVPTYEPYRAPGEGESA